MNREQIGKINREAWNEAAPIHGKTKFKRLYKGLQKAGYSCIGPVKTDRLLRHGVRGKSVFQPCCNHGGDLVSLKNLGATRCFGFDISEAFIEQGRQLAAAAGTECEFIQADVYGLGHDYDGQFDIGYVTTGTLWCLPDLDGFFSVVSRLMRPGAWMFMLEIHPILDMYNMEPSKKPKKTCRSYFTRKPIKVARGLDYHRFRPYRGKPAYMFHHKLSDIIQACVNSGLLIETFEELDREVSGGKFRKFERKKHRLPLSFILTARRPRAENAPCKE